MTTKPNRDAIAVLRAARKLLARKGAWVPHHPHSANQHCAVTAINQGAVDLRKIDALPFAWESAGRELRGKLQLPEWNDRQKSVKPVLALIDRAIRRLERGS